MHKKFKHLLSTSILSSVLLFSSPAFSQDLDSYILAPMPTWFSERFTQGHLDIQKMMKDGFTRAEAVEIQNQMKDILDNDPVYQKLEDSGTTYDMVRRKDPFILQALEMAIKNVKEKRIFESRFVPAKLKGNEFYVAFDLDETLLVQWYGSGEKGSKYYDFDAGPSAVDNILRPTLLSPTYVSLTPGIEKTLRDISEIPGCKGIVFFSAKLDTATNAVVDKITFEGKPVRNFIKGLFTRNYLIREQEPTKLSKDLRIIDESLEHVILIDDNPTRILDKQKRNLREFPKYNPDEYLKAKNETKDQVVMNYFEKLLPTVVDEIKETAEYSRKNNIPFVEAYFPYSTDGEAKVIMLMKQGYSMTDAVSFIRKNSKMFEPKFFFYEDKVE